MKEHIHNQKTGFAQNVQSLNMDNIKRFPFLCVQCSSAQLAEKYTLPTPEDMSNLRPHDYVKVGFVFNNDSKPTVIEFMWLYVIQPGYGLLENTPKTKDSDVKFGDMYYFEPRHIVEIVKHVKSNLQ